MIRTLSQQYSAAFGIQRDISRSTSEEDNSHNSEKDNGSLNEKSSSSITESDVSSTPPYFWVNELEATLDPDSTKVNDTDNDNDDDKNADKSNIQDISLSDKAMQYSTTAASLLSKKEYQLSLDTYAMAVECYDTKREQDEQVALSAINSAGCFRNMSTVCRAKNDYNESIKLLEKAEELYVKSQEHVTQFIKAEQNDSKLRLSKQSIINVGDLSTVQEYVCLDSLILETIQTRAFAIEEYQNNINKASICHELILHRLLDLDDLKDWDEFVTQSIRIDNVMFTPMSKEQHTDLLIMTLRKLICLYQTPQIEKDKDLMPFEEGVTVIRQLHQDQSDNEEITQFLTSVLRILSDLYFARGDIDDAVDALRDALFIRLQLSGEPCSEALEIIERMGHASEEIQDYDKALECYEKILEARTRHLGDEHRDVAKSIVNIARVKELQHGSNEETMELYKAANEIFSRENANSNQSKTDVGSDMDDVRSALKQIPLLLRDGDFEDAVDHLQHLLSIVESDVDLSVTLDKAQINFDLCRAYIGLGDKKTAEKYLIEVINELGIVLDENSFKRPFTAIPPPKQSEINNTTSVLDHIESASYHIFSDEIADDPTLQNPDISAYIPSDISTTNGNIDNVSKIGKSVTQKSSNPCEPTVTPRNQDDFDDMAWLQIQDERSSVQSPETSSLPCPSSMSKRLSNMLLLSKTKSEQIFATERKPPNVRRAIFRRASSLRRYLNCKLDSSKKKVHERDTIDLRDECKIINGSKSIQVNNENDKLILPGATNSVTKSNEKVRERNYGSSPVSKHIHDYTKLVESSEKLSDEQTDFDYQFKNVFNSYNSSKKITPQKTENKSPVSKEIDINDLQMSSPTSIAPASPILSKEIEESTYTDLQMSSPSDTTSGRVSPMLSKELQKSMEKELQMSSLSIIAPASPTLSKGIQSIDKECQMTSPLNTNITSTSPATTVEKTTPDKENQKHTPSLPTTHEPSPNVLKMKNQNELSSYGESEIDYSFDTRNVEKVSSSWLKPFQMPPNSSGSPQQRQRFGLPVLQDKGKLFQGYLRY